MTSVSVIITVLNEEKTIQALLESLRAQTYPIQEIIVTDGGSSDHTVEVLNTFKKKYPQLSLSIFEVKGNRSRGRNFAIEKTHTKVIAITDAGCVPYPNWIAELVKKYDESKEVGIDLVIAGYYDAQPKNGFEEAVVPYVLVMPDRVNPATFLPATRSVLIEKEVWKDVGGFNEKLKWNEDYEFAIRLEKKNVRIVFAKGAVVSWVPRQNLVQFFTMIHRFAKGDVQAGIWRKKVLFLFARYILGALFLLLLVLRQAQILAAMLSVMAFILYSSWSIVKNSKYVPNGKLWLPLLQVTADLAVIMGSLAGLV